MILDLIGIGNSVKIFNESEFSKIRIRLRSDLSRNDSISLRFVSLVRIAKNEK